MKPDTDTATSSFPTRRIPAEPHSAQLARIRKFVDLLDTAWRIPGTRFRIGLDPIIGLIPGVGDVVSMALSAAIELEAKKLGVSKLALTRMIGNLAVDAVIGSIPLLGDIFDSIWKANARNLRILERELERQRTK